MFSRVFNVWHETTDFNTRYLYLREEDIVGCECNLTKISMECGTSEPSSNHGLVCYAYFHFNALGKCMNSLLLL